MAAYRLVYDSHHLQADCQEPGSAPEPYAGLTYSLLRYNRRQRLCWLFAENLAQMTEQYHALREEMDSYLNDLSNM